MEELKKEQQTNMEELKEELRQLKGSSKIEIIMQLVIFFGGCSLASLATFHLTRR